MSCSSLNSISRSCDGNIGGIKKVYLWDIEDQITYTPNGTTWQLSALAVTGGSAGIKEFQFTRESSNYTEELASDLVNGSTTWSATLNLMFTRREALKSKAVKVMADGQRYLGALVEDNNGLFWVFQDLQITTSGEGSGTTKEDGSKYSVALLGKTGLPAYEIAGASAALFISNGTV
jgi:hypothetical protein